MKAVATIKLRFDKSEQLSAILAALKPETRTSLTSRSRVRIKREEDDILTLIFEANDTSALRATLNSYLHWIRSTRDTLDALEN